MNFAMFTIKVAVDNRLRLLSFFSDPYLGMVLMDSVTSYQTERIAEGLVSVWMHEK